MHVLLLALVLLMGEVTGFAVLSFGGRRTGMRLTAESSQGAQVSFGQGLKGRGRRRFMEEVCVGVGGWMVGVGGAGAEVSAGTSLPDGAAQFSRVLKSQRDISALLKSLSTSPPTDEKQWKVLSLYIRGLYTLADDMAFIGKGLGEKKGEGERVVAEFRKVVKASDVPVKSENVEVFKAEIEKADNLIKQFLELLQDVPSDI
ncbi:hypothetical protein TrLO_g2956 [Triparma laevis f. longispina]|uniref:Uncharacterized protein n=1 Tax=Triparma laevis f. longispina TaxID=1714387 RepID=A0A9W7FI52_9STRA|nr:hypothetical protein TrLO_g2956 [Triparma laevis f. longispina]